MTEDFTGNDTGDAGGQAADSGPGGESQGFTGAEGAEQLIGQAGILVGRPAPGESVEISAEPGQTYVLDFDPSQARALVEGDNLILVFEDGGHIVFENLVNLAQLENSPSIQYAGADIIALLQAQGIIPGVFDSFDLIQAELGQRFTITFDPAIAQISVDGDNLVMTFPGGGQIVIVGLGSLTDQLDAPLFSIAGAEIPGGTLMGTAAAASGGESSPDATATLETAAGGDEPVGTGATQYSDDTGDIIDTIGAQGVIPPTALEFDVPESDPTGPIDLPKPPVAFSSTVSAGEGVLIGIPDAEDTAGSFVYKFDVGEENDISDNIHGTDEEDGVTTAFTITSLPEFGMLVVDSGDDGTLDAVYGVSNAFITAAAALPPGGIQISSDDAVYYFLPIEQVLANEEDGGLGGDSTSSTDSIVGSISVQFDYFTTDSSGLSSAESTLGVTFNAKPVVSATDGVVDEAALSDGSNPGSPNETDTGTFTINTFGDGLATLTVGGVDVTGGGVVNGTYGVLTVTETAGAYSWSYTLSDNTTDHPDDTSTGTSEGIVDEFSVAVTDSDGDVSAENTLTVAILDDGPDAVDDTTTTAEDTQVTYNVITNTDSTSDSSGADAPATLTAASLASGSATFDGFNANGEITVTPDAGYEGDIVVNYTITDADGDTSDATLTITVGPDSTPTVTSTDSEVDESALVPDGSGGGSVTDGGSFTIGTGGDTLAQVEVQDKDGAWIDVTSGVTPVTGDYGTLVVTETAGSYTWVYTLGGATADHTGADLVGPADQVPDDFSVRVTDSDNDVSAADAFVIQINDDGPGVDATVTGEAGVVLATQDAQTIGLASDTDTSTADFSGVFGVTKDGGADGEQGTVVTYALALLGGFTEGDPSGLEIGGVAINLYETGGVIFGSTAGTEGAVNAGNTVFEISVSASGVVTLTQHQQIDHDTVEGAPAYDDDQQFLADGRVGLTATAVITDGDGDTATDSETVDLGGNLRFDDDGPSPVTADKAFVANSGDAVGSGDLNFLGNAGADQPGDIQFDSALSGTILARSGGGAAITSGEEAIFLNVSGDGHTLTALADTDGNFGTTGDQTTVFTIVLDPLADDYTIDFDATLDDGAGFVLDDFSAAPAGQNEWIGLDTDLYTNGVLDPLGTPVDIEFDHNDSQDLLITWIKPGNNPGTVNTSSFDLAACRT